MNRSYRIIPCYTGDVSGVAAALFEMGGMVVIHDPSGCNSTYNTHDETRWYDTDSLIFITGLSNTDAIMGDDEKLIREVEEAAEQLHPAFIALTSSPIPYMNGTDFPAIARLLQRDTGIPAFFVPSNGMHDYVYGAGNAFLAAAERLLDSRKQPEEKKKTVNLLGVTPLEFSAEGAAESLRGVLEERGLRIQSCWAMGDTREQLQTAAEASVNLVVSATGFPMAKYMERTFGIPWVAGCPTGAFTDKLVKALRRTMEDGICRIPYLDRTAGTAESAAGSSRKGPEGDAEQKEKRETLLVGEPVTMGSLAAALAEKTGAVCHVVCPVEAAEELTGEQDIRTFGEEGAEQALKTAGTVIADPLYRPICPPDAEFLELPHQAFSGRCFRRSMKNIVTDQITAYQRGKE